MDIEGLGEKNVMRFSDEGLITDPASIYDLIRSGSPSSRVRRDLGERAHARDRGLQEPVRPRSMRSASRIGWVNAAAIAGAFGIDRRADRRRRRGDHRGGGDRPVLAESLREELADGAVLELISRLRERGLRFEVTAAERRAESGPLDGKTFVLTGTLPELSRDEATRLIRAAGGKVTGSVSKNTEYLVAGDSPGTKLAKAEEVGTEIIDEGACATSSPTPERRSRRRSRRRFPRAPAALNAPRGTKAVLGMDPLMIYIGVAALFLVASLAGIWRHKPTRSCPPASRRSSQAKSSQVCGYRFGTARIERRRVLSVEQSSARSHPPVRHPLVETDARGPSRAARAPS